MEKATVWTRQHKQAWRQLEESGRYLARREYIIAEMPDCAHLILEAYDWLVRNSPNQKCKPPDATYPIWVSLTKASVMPPETDFVRLELQVDPASISRVNIAKWGTILNYSYIPADAADADRHNRLLRVYHTSDPQAYMSRSYPEIKEEIIASWARLFDDSVGADNSNCYGIIWELRREWVVKVGE